MIIKINCKSEEFTNFIEINDSDIIKVKKLSKEYTQLYDNGEICCSYFDFLSENNIDFVEADFETIEI